MNSCVYLAVDNRRSLNLGGVIIAYTEQRHFAGTLAIVDVCSLCSVPEYRNEVKRPPGVTEKDYALFTVGQNISKPRYRVTLLCSR